MKSQPTMSLRLLILSVLVVEFVGATPQWHQAKDGRSYLIEREAKLSWAEASRECTRRGLQLVAIQSAGKNIAFDALLRTLFDKSPDLWIGGSDHEGTGAKERPFYWSITGKRITFANWGNGQPDNKNGLEHCAHIYSATNFQWNDTNCEQSKLGYICEGRNIEY